MMKSNNMLCIDPSRSRTYYKYLEKINKLNYILNTHHHYDHVGGNKN